VFEDLLLLFSELDAYLGHSHIKLLIIEFAKVLSVHRFKYRLQGKSLMLVQPFLHCIYDLLNICEFLLEVKQTRLSNVLEGCAFLIVHNNSLLLTLKDEDIILHFLILNLQLLQSHTTMASLRINAVLGSQCVDFNLESLSFLDFSINGLSGLLQCFESVISLLGELLLFIFLLLLFYFHLLELILSQFEVAFLHSLVPLHVLHLDHQLTHL
jgi:hypothetical protein